MTDDQTARIQVPTWAQPLYQHFRYKILYGGRASGKTWQVAIALVVQSFAEPLRVICVREHKSALRLSAKPAIEEAISLTKLPGFRVGREEIRHENGSWFSFEGASTSTEEDIKGWEGVHRCWFEEAHRMSERSRRLIYPTIFRRKESQFWATFNPRLRSDPIYRDFVSGAWGEDSRYVCHVNYSGNPWLPEGEEELRREWEKHDPITYPTEWLGIPDDADAEKHILTYGVLLKCVKAYDLYAQRQTDTLVDAGLDVADAGKNYNAMCVRRGAAIEHIEKWPAEQAGYLAPTAARADRIAGEYKVWVISFDAGGVGSAMRGEFARLADGRSQHTYSTRGVSFGGAVGGPGRIYLRGRTNEQMFNKRNIQMGWSLRMRAQNTIRLLNDEPDIDLDTCLFINPKIPRLEEYLADLTQPVWRDNPVTGKTEMDKRGEEGLAESPDMYDATALAFARDSDSGLRAPY